MLNGTVLPVVGGGALDVEVVADVIHCIGLTLVGVPVEGLQDETLFLRQRQPCRFEPVHVLNGLSVPLLQHIDLINGCDDAALVCLRVVRAFRHARESGAAHGGHVFLHSTNLLLGVVKDVLHTAIVLQSIDGSAAFVQIAVSYTHLTLPTILLV